MIPLADLSTPDSSPEEVDPALDHLIHQISLLSVSSKSKLLNAVYADSPPNTNPFPPSNDPNWTTIPPKRKRPNSWSLFAELHKRFNCDADARYQDEIEHLRRDRHILKSRFAAAHQKLDDERNHAEQKIAIIQAKVAELSQVHVRSVNGIGAGLDPISDQTFTEVLAEHHLKTFQWCRKNLRGKKLLDHDNFPKNLQSLIAERCSGWPTDLSVARVADLIFWFGLEAVVLKPWFPVEVTEGQDCDLERAEWGFTRDGA